jgi:hypothetical protein
MATAAAPLLVIVYASQTGNAQVRGRGAAHHAHYTMPGSAET